MRKEIAAVETEDNGSLLMGNSARMVPRAALNIQFFADRALKLNDEKIDSPEVVNHVRFDPAGVAALITPWNGPFMLTTWKVGPCLAAGDTAVVKPPEWAPLTCSMMADLATEAGIPPGVLNVVHGIGEEAGAALAAHPDIDRLSFTGSTDTAKLIGASTARSLTPVSFRARRQVTVHNLRGRGPRRGSEDRGRPVFQRGPGMPRREPASWPTRKSPMSFNPEIPRGGFATDSRRSASRRQPASARSSRPNITNASKASSSARSRPGSSRFGAVIITRPDELYFEPTLLDGVDPGHGDRPARGLRSGAHLADLGATRTKPIELANGTDYGLAAVIFSRNEEHAMRLARQVVGGTVWVNCFFVRDLAAPFGGSRNSGSRPRRRQLELRFLLRREEHRGVEGFLRLMVLVSIKVSIK